MKTRLILFCIPLLFFVAGCKKKSALTAATARVKTVAFSSPGWSDTYTLTYTADGKLLLYQGSMGDKFTYTYSGNTVTVNQYDTSSTLQETDVYYLNSQGLADSAVLGYGGTGNYESFVYDANGYKIKMTIYDNTNTLLYIYYWTITNGNPTYYYYTDNATNIMGTQTTTYLTDKLSSTRNSNSGLAFLGNSAVNLASSASTTSASANPVTYTYTYSYDANGLETMMTSTGNGIITWNYSYY